MKLNIGENIKRLRKERDITQEEFAEMLGVSCQSVSRWENASCYPDIELIPTIASFFGISADRLMGMDEKAEKAAVDRYSDEFQAAISVGNMEECIRIARAGVSEFPNNYALLNKLMYALFVACSDDANIPNWKENQKKYDSEIVSLGERIIRYCPDIKIRYEATNRLAFHHCETGRKDIGRTLYETLPSLSACKEWGIWWALSEKEKLPHTRKFILNAYYALAEGLWRLTDLVPDEDAVNVFEKLHALNRLIYDHDPPDDNWCAASYYFKHAKHLVKLNRIEEAIDHLHLSVKHAIAFDERPDEIKTNSLLLGKQIRRKTDFDTADSRPLREILRDSWLKETEFDSIRNTAEFKAVLKKLNQNI